MRWLVATVTLVTLVGCASAPVAGDPGSSTPTTLTPPPSIPTTSPATSTLKPSPALPFDAARARRIEQAFASGDPAALAGVIALRSDDRLDAAAATAFAAQPLRIDPATFQPHADVASVEATRGTEHWRLWLVAERGQWMIAATERR